MKLGDCSFMVASIDTTESQTLPAEHYQTTNSCWWQKICDPTPPNSNIICNVTGTSTTVYLDPNSFIQAISVFVLLSAVIGFVLNSVVIAISLSRQRPIAGEYKYFVLNASLVACVRCLMFPSVSYSLLWRHSIANRLAGYVSYTNLIYVLVLLPISLNRYTCILFNHVYQQLFSKRNICLMCAVSDVLIFVVPLLLELDWFGGRLTFQLLIGFGVQLFKVTYSQRWLRAAAFMGATQLTVLVVDVVIVVLNGRVVRHICRHEQTALAIMTAERLAENRTITRATLIQALLPILVQLPLLMKGLVSLILALVASSVLFGGGYIKAYLYMIVFALGTALPTLDAIITLLVVKQYRERFFLLCSKQKVTPASTAPLQSSRKRRQENVNQVTPVA